MLQVTVIISKPQRPGRKVAIAANERETQVVPLAASGAVGGESRKEGARVRGASVQSGARRSPDQGNGGRVEE